MRTLRMHIPRIYAARPIEMVHAHTNNHTHRQMCVCVLHFFLKVSNIVEKYCTDKPKKWGQIAKEVEVHGGLGMRTVVMMRHVYTECFSHWLYCVDLNESVSVILGCGRCFIVAI